MNNVIAGIQGDKSPLAHPAAAEPAAVFPLGFFILAAAVSWAFWMLPLAAARGWITWPWVGAARTPLLMGGAFGPFVAAFVLTLPGSGGRGALALLGQALRWKIPPRGMFTTLFLCPVAAGLAAYVQFRSGGPALTAPELWPTLQLFVLLFFLGGSFQEEFGWAYAIDRLQGRWPALPAAAALGLLWGLWHLPLFFIPGTGQSYMPLWSFLIGTVAARIIMVWIYNGANRSILALLLFHTSFNLSLNLFPVLRQELGATQTTWLCYVALLAAAAVGPALALRRQPANGSETILTQGP